MRVVILGAGGQLGSEVALRAETTGTDAVALTRVECDINDPAAIARALDRHACDTVINCAAWTDVDGAEIHQAEVFAVNAAGPGLLAVECDRRAILLVHISTDYVFSGSGDEPITEHDPTAPLSVYGASKLAGENAIGAVSDRHQVVRTSGLYGRDGPNFVLKVLQRAAGGAELRVVDDQITSPTWTAHLADAILRLAERGTPGTYHITNSGSASWHEVATAAVALAGFEASVAPIKTSDLAPAAERPRYSVLDNGAWLRLGEPALPSWDSALRAYIEELRGRGRLPRA